MIYVKIRELEKYLFVDFGKIEKEYFRRNVEQETRIIWVLKWDPMKRLCMEMLYSFVLWNRKTKAKHKERCKKKIGPNFLLHFNKVVYLSYGDVIYLIWKKSVLCILRNWESNFGINFGKNHFFVFKPYWHYTHPWLNDVYGFHSLDFGFRKEKSPRFSFRICFLR